MKPTFLVIGAYKCGSTSLHNHLRAHPEVFVPERKEPGFYAFATTDPASPEAVGNPAYARSVSDRRDYEALFGPYAGQRAVGEVSPEYMTNPDALVNIAAELPDVKLVAIVRDPVERAFSDYLMNVRDQREHDDFATALAAQADRAAQRSPNGYYVSTGFYGAQLQPYYEHFGAERIVVVLAEDLRADPVGTMARVFEFIGVDPARAVDPGQEFNRSGVPTSAAMRLAYRVRGAVGPLAHRVVPERVKHRLDGFMQSRLDRPELPEDSARMLAELYADDIALLGRLIGRDLSAWGSTS